MLPAFFSSAATLTIARHHPRWRCAFRLNGCDSAAQEEYRVRNTDARQRRTMRASHRRMTARTCTFEKAGKMGWGSDGCLSWEAVPEDVLAGDRLNGDPLTRCQRGQEHHGSTPV